MAKQYIDFIFKYSKLVMLIIVLASIGSAFLFSQLPIETSVESMILENDPDLIFYEKFKEQFGEDEFIVVAYTSSALFSPEMLKEIDHLTKQLELIDEVKEVVSLTNIETIIGSDFDFIVQPLCETLPETKNEASLIKSTALGLKSVRDTILSKNADASLFLIRTIAHEEDETYDLRLLNQINDIFLENQTQKGSLTPDTIYTAGWLVTDVTMSKNINHDNMVFMPILYVIICVFLFITLKNIAFVMIGIVNITLCLLWTMAALHLVGGSLSPMTAILSPLILALSVSDSVHLLLHFLKKERKSKGVTQMIRLSVDELSKPCFLTSFTTAIGFLSLMVSEIPPIRHFGLAASCGMIIELFLTMTFVPICIYLFRKKDIFQKVINTDSNIMTKFSRWLLQFIPKWKYFIVIVSIFLTASSIWFAFKIKVETNFIDYFKKDSAVARNYYFIDENLNGVDTLEISFHSDSPDFFLQPSNLKLIEKMEKYLESMTIVGNVTSMNTFIREMHKSFNNEDRAYFKIPNDKNLIAQYLLIYGGDELYNFVDEAYAWTKISARISEHSSVRLQEYLANIQDFIDTSYASSGIEIKITGKTLMVNKLVKSIVNSQVYSLLLAFVIIFIILFFVFRSFSLGVLSIIPNSIPIIFSFGTMGLLGIPLNTATAIISAVAIGIAVDDTIHFLSAYQEGRNKNKSVGESALYAISKKGEPITITSIILFFGFGVLMFSSFVPTIQFGFLCSIIMLSALFCDLMVLPSFMLLFTKKMKYNSANK